MKPFVFSILCILLSIIILFTEACSSKKDTVASIGMQNLTARFNIFYNATELLNESHVNIETAYLDDYEQLLSIYKEPSSITSKSEQKNLDSVIKKMNFLIDEKIKSNYVDDAYFLKGKANYFKGDYFNASEFFNYVYTTFPEEKEIKQASLAWKARALIQLGNLVEAKIVLDSANKNIAIEKNSVADIYATSAHYFIRRERLDEAAKMLEQALEFEKSKATIIRWTYLLAQLQERTNQLQLASENYTRVIKSNAPFEMAFNAKLNRIHIEEEQSGNTSKQVERLEALLSDNKSREFIDQIHYRIAGIHKKNGRLGDAIKSYNTAIRSSLKNQNQKGLAYAQLAEIYFKGGGYQLAKTYYDSTLTALSPAYASYEQIRLKSSNLDQLAKSFRTISRQDTLQILARLPQNRRDQFIDSLFQNQSQSINGSFVIFPIQGSSSMMTSNAKFYFNNPLALRTGSVDFVKRWGNRKLEDNWRISVKTSAESVALAADTTLSKSPLTAGVVLTNDSLAFRKIYIDDLPLTTSQLDLSNQKIVNAYFDIANFYKDVLKADTEAIDTYLQILSRYPESGLKPAIYYNLYRLYASIDAPKSAQYRDILLREYPQSAFARTIIDPSYNQRADEQLLALNNTYNSIYEVYSEKKYTEVISKIQQGEQVFGENSLSPQLAYLKALATGRTQKVEVFESSLQQLVKSYPTDQLVTPLAKQHLEYVQANRDAMSRRDFALIDFDPNEPRFIEPKSEPALQQAVSQQIFLTSPKNMVITPSAMPPSSPITTNIPTGAMAASTPALFSLPDSSEYYFVVNVLNPRTALSSSRFGIGQFNRSNYASVKISHQLQAINRENQLIFVGPFFTRLDVERYERTISPLIKEIMKIQAPTYNTFVITKEGLERLSTREIINSYIDFYTDSREWRNEIKP